MGAWVIGHNIAGYLPESDTVAYADRSEALEAFVSMCREYADEDDERNDALALADWSGEDFGSMRATVDSIVRDGDHRSVRDESAGMVIADSDDRRVSFWMQWEPTREPNDSE